MVSRIDLKESDVIDSVSQMSRNEVQIRLSTAHHAHYAHAFFLSVFVSVGNKGHQDQLPKLKVASSIPAARSIVALLHG